jgi:uncharacterized protein YndB with AHSA1/START domain
VWEVVSDCEGWGRWWRGVERSKVIARGDEDGVGVRIHSRWRGAVPYVVRFESETVRVERPHVIEVRARGELVGRGVWRLYEGDGTCVTYDWHVETTATWMNALAPLARPLFEWNHDTLMRRGAEGLARELGCELLAAT